MTTIDDAARDRRAFWWFMAAALVVLGAGIGLRDPWPPDEPRFALVARQMLESGQWLFPHRGIELYSDKPPLLMWCEAAVLWLFGGWRGAFLLPSLLAGLGSLGWAQYKLGYYEEALSNLQRAYKAFRDHEVAAHLGEVLWVMGREREANRIWEDALNERPDSDLLKTVMTRLRSGADN